MKKIFTVPVVILKTKSGFNAFSPEIDGCIVTDRTMDRTLHRLKEALTFHLEGQLLVHFSQKRSASAALRHAFRDYGTDAMYASVQLAA